MCPRSGRLSLDLGELVVFLVRSSGNSRFVDCEFDEVVSGLVVLSI